MKKTLVIMALLLSPLAASADFMDETWAKAACEAWNQSEILTNKLGKAGEGERPWVLNNGERGYKLIQMYRSNCGEASKIQLNIVEKEGKAFCEYGGKPDGKATNYDMDYLMHATDEDWTCMGKGEWGCGAMGAMMSGKLQFQGPKLEAMSVMDPFGSFLTLTGTVAGEKTACK